MGSSLSCLCFSNFHMHTVDPPKIVVTANNNDARQVPPQQDTRQQQIKYALDDMDKVLEHSKRQLHRNIKELKQDTISSNTTTQD